MKIQSVKLIYFSPTRTTRKVLEGIAKGLPVDQTEPLDLTNPKTGKQAFEEIHDELAIIGTPVYGGRVPVDATVDLKRLKARQTPAVVVVLYGNREYEDALLELKNIAMETGFKPFAGAAFIGEHSFSSDAAPIAAGRPDADDLKKAMEFGDVLWKQLGRVASIDDIFPVQVPGNFPYKERMKAFTISPITREAICTACGTCAAVCPKEAIVIEDTVMTDVNACIACCACVKNCPTQARVMEDPIILQKAAWLSANCHERKEPQLYTGFYHKADSFNRS
ncbi:MAG: 4Fe-4S binding protein [Desulfobacterales bacterium]